MATFPTEADRFGSSAQGSSTVSNAGAGQPARPDSFLAEVPVIVHASHRSATSGQPGQAQTVREETSTLLIFSRGAVLRLSSTLSRGDLVVLTNQQNRADMLCRAVYVREQAGGGSYVELEFTQRSSTFWSQERATASAAPSFASSAPGSATPNSAPFLAPVLAFPGTARPPASVVPPPVPIAPLRNEPPASRPEPASVPPSSLQQTATVPSVPTAVDEAAMDPEPITSAARAAFAQAGAAESADAFELEAPPLRSQRSFVDRLKEWSHSPLLWVFCAALTIIAFLGESFLMGHHGSSNAASEVATARAIYPAQPAAARTSGATSPSQPITLDSISVVSATHPKDEAAADVSATNRAETPARHDASNAIRIGKLAPTAPRPAVSASSEPPPELPAQGANIADHLIGAGSLSGAAAAGGPAPVSAAASVAAANAPAAPPSDYRAPKVISSTAPVYPQFARAQGIAGIVVLDATIDATGRVTGARVVSGPPLLTQAALDSVRQWKYQPAELNGQAVPSRATINVNFAHQ